MHNLNWFDIALVMVVLWSALTGMRAGLARVVVGFAAVIIGLLAGFWFYRIVAAKLMPMVKSITVADILGFFIIFVGVVILGSLIASLLSRLMHWFGLSWFNHFLGLVAGLFRGALVITAVCGMFVAFAPSPMPDFLAHSRVLPYLSEVTSWLVSLAPRELRDAYDEQMQNLQRLWSQPSGHEGQIA